MDKELQEYYDLNFKKEEGWEFNQLSEADIRTIKNSFGFAFWRLHRAKDEFIHQFIHDIFKTLGVIKRFFFRG